LPNTSQLFRKPYIKFIFNRSGPFDKPVTLDRNRVYILPTRSGLIFSLLLLLLLIGSVNYDKSLGFVLTFLLVGVGNVALLSTWKNLAGLRLSAGGCAPVFAGDDAVFAVQLENTDQKPKYAIGISHDGTGFETIDVPDNRIHLIHFHLKTRHRGYCNPKQFRLYTEFPMGLFVAWTIIDLSMSCLVYPEPAETFDTSISGATEEGGQSITGTGNEEFTGLKKYQPGESWRRISWKVMARTNQLYTKEFNGGQPQLLWIDWDNIPAKTAEHRLSIMARMVIDAQSSGCHYGLRLNEIELTPDTGNAHYHHCMKCLALYGN